MAQGEGILGLISQSILEADMVFCRYITANDTGAHQSGIYIPKRVGQILLAGHTSRGQNVDLRIRIHWQGGLDLFTLQSGISKRQLEEMGAAGVTLVVPAAHKSAYVIRNARSAGAARWGDGGGVGRL